MEKTVNGFAGGQHIAGAPLTLTNTATASPELLKNSIDENIVRIRPMSTPIDQLSRCAGARSCDSMTVEYYSVDTKATETALAADVIDGNISDYGMEIVFNVKVKDAIFEPSETVLFPDLKDPNGGLVTAYVTDSGTDGSLTLLITSGTNDALLNAPKGTKIVRMGRAATELDVQTAQFQALPQKKSNTCQIFKMQVEQSTLQKIAGKEVPWGFSDQEEAAVIDMRLGMEKNFLFGTGKKIYDRVKNEDVYLTGGIWNQTENSFSYNPDTLTEEDLISICARAFTGNNGSKRKILLAGTGLMERLSKLQFSRVVYGDQSFVKWGIEFREIRSNFGSLYVLHSEVFDQCGHANDGFIIDPDYITKYVHIPFSVEKLDLRRSGQRNTEAVVLTEASCLVLRYPNAHLRIISQA